MNRAKRGLRSDDRAEFSILLALFFVFALINTSGSLQQRAQATGKEATQEVSSNLKVVGVYGYRNSSTDDLRVLKVNVELSAGALPIDLQQLVIRYADGKNAPHAYGWSDVDLADSHAEDATFFSTSWIRGEGRHDVMEAGDLVELKFIVAHDLPIRTDVDLDLIPEVGSPVSVDFRTPATYSTDRTIVLR